MKNALSTIFVLLLLVAFGLMDWKSRKRKEEKP
jgi:hypothetical protein